MPVADTWYRTVKQPDGSTKKEKSAHYGRGKRWAARYRDDDGKQKNPKFRTKVEAEQHLTNIKGDLQRGEYVDPKAGKVTLQAFAEEWLANLTVEESTKEAMEKRLQLHVFPHLGSQELRKLKPSVIRSWLAGLQTHLASSSTRTIFEHLSGALAAAVDDGLIARNPCASSSVKAPVPEKRKVVPWTLERVAAVEESIPPRYRAYVVPGAGCGLRQGETIGLAAEDVGFLDGTLYVRRQVKKVRNKLCFAPPKHGKEREIPLPEHVALRLSAHIAQFPPVSVTLPWRHPEGEPVTAQLIFTSRESKPLNKNYINKFVWKPALVDAGVLSHQASAREHGYHALRHHFASVLLEAGVSIRALAEYLGHADPGFTLRTYAHMMPNSEAKMRGAIDRVWSMADGSHTSASAPNVRPILS